MITLATAHPAKFPEAVERATGQISKKKADLKRWNRRLAAQERKTSEMRKKLAEKIDYFLLSRHRVRKRFVTEIDALVP